MIKYLLPAWKSAIDKKVYEEVKRHSEDPKLSGIGGNFRGVWYHVCGFLDQEVRDGNMISEFRPFADAFAKELIKTLLDNIERDKQYKAESLKIKQEIADKEKTNV